MKLVLKKFKTLVMLNEKTIPRKNEQLMKVLYCGVCRTDAKMYFQGQRDLVLPRVLGHEMVVQDEVSKEKYIVWPGNACGNCYYCLSKKENLCDRMKIMGFHIDGGFQEYVSVAPENLIPLPTATDPALAALAEPMGCVMNVFTGLDADRHKNILIYGGGTLGLMTAFTAHSRGIHPVIIERNIEKLSRILKITGKTKIECLSETDGRNFDAAINTCPDSTAFGNCITKLKKGAALCFFSGLTKNEEISTSILNLIHYKALEVKGYYGLTREHMREALSFISGNESLCGALVEKVIGPSRIVSVMENIIRGHGFKYIADFS